MKPKIGTAFGAFLDIARVLAAAAVFLNHLRDPLFLGYPQLPASQRNPIVSAWFFLTGFGFSAVMVFFVLSGFLVGGIGLERIKNRTFVPSSYFIDRISRLFVVFVPAIIMTALVDALSLHFFPSLGFWDNSNPVIASKFSEGFSSHADWRTFACNLVMMQPFHCQIFSSNVPLWSLSYEFWFYMCFGILCLSVVGGSRFRLFALVSIGGIVAILGSSFLWLSVIWLFGVGAYHYEGNRLRKPLIAFPVFLISAALVRAMHADQPKGDIVNNVALLAEGAAFAWVLISMRDTRNGWLARLQPICARLASFSYTLYLIHFPMMLLVIALLAKMFGLGNLSHGVPPFSAIGIGLYLGVFAIVVGLAWLFASFTEAHTHRVRAWVRGRIAIAFRDGRIAG